MPFCALDELKTFGGNRKKKKLQQKGKAYFSFLFDSFF